MATFSGFDFAAGVLSDFEKYTKKPERFLSSNNKAVPRFRELAKSIYDFTKSSEKKGLCAGTLNELIVDSFDDEQVWQEIDLQNVARTVQLVKSLSHVLARKDALRLGCTNVNEDKHESSGDEASSLSNYESDYDNENEKGSLSDSNSKVHNPREQIKSAATSRKAVRTSVVDDKFFKLSELEEFLNTEDEKERKRQKREELGKEEDEEDESEEEIDYFAPISSEGESNEDDSDSNEHVEEGARNCRYGDFFDPASEHERTISYEGQEAVQEADSAWESVDDSTGDMELQDDLHEETQDMNVNHKRSANNDEDHLSKKEKSDFEIRQEKLKTKIATLEDSNLAEKPWQLKGEISASLRPENSLLQEHLQFEHTQRQAPPITEETTHRLEDIIQQRIKDKAWDDVERKVKPKEEPFEYKKRILLDQEKSKISLAEVYEQEYIKQQQVEKTETELPEHIEIKKMMKALFGKLDALSNFHFTPKRPAPEVKIVSNLPSVTVEEVAPVTASAASMLTPGEILTKPSRDLKGKSEREKSDRAQARRLKKVRQRKHRKEREARIKLVEKVDHTGNKYAKENLLKKLVDDVEKDSGKRKFKTDLASSKAVFGRLNEMQARGSKPSKVKVKKKNVNFKL